MIKGRIDIAGKPHVLIGLSAENCRRLLSGQPIHFDGCTVGVTGLGFVIVGAQTENDIIDDLRSAGLEAERLSKGS